MRLPALGTAMHRRACLRLIAAVPALLAVPCRAAAAPEAGSVLAVLTDAGNTLQLLDPATLETRVRLPLPCKLRTLAALPGSAALVGAGALGDLLLLDARRGELLAQATLGSGEVQAAVSSDGRWVLAAAAGSAELRLFDAKLQSVKSWPLPGSISWLADAAHRRSFVLSLADRGMVWEISYNERAEDFYEGLVHDYRMGEGVPQRGFHNARRMPLAEPLLAGTFDAETTEIAGRGLVFNLDVRRVIRRHAALQGVAAGSASVFEHRGRRVLALPTGESRRVEWFRTGDWAHLGTLELPGPVRFVRGHARWPAVAVDAGASLVLVDRESLRPAGELRLTAASLVPVLPSADGSRLWALAADGRLQAFDAPSWQPGRSRELRDPVAFAATGV